MGSKLRVAIADDDEIFLENFSKLLDLQEGFTVVATASNGADAIAMASLHELDMILLDVDMPVLDGIRAADTIQKTAPGVTVVMLTAFAHEDSLEEALATGVRAFLTKDTPITSMVALLREAHAGKMVMGTRPTELLTRQYMEKREKQQMYERFVQDVRDLPHHLKPIFSLVIQAIPNKEIAQKLGLSESTVRSYVSHILDFTGCATRGELAITAVRAGIHE